MPGSTRKAELSRHRSRSLIYGVLPVLCRSPKHRIWSSFPWGWGLLVLFVGSGNASLRPPKFPLLLSLRRLDQRREQGAHRGGLSDAVGCNVAGHKLHCVIDR